MKKNRFGFTGESALLINLSTEFSKTFYLFSTLVGTVILAIAGAFGSGFHPVTSWSKASGFWQCSKVIFLNCWWFFPIGAIFLFVGGIGTYRDQKTLVENNKNLIKENHSVKKVKNDLDSTLQDCELLRAEKHDLYKKLVKTWLQMTSKHLGINTHERVTLYFMFEKNFYLLARYSANPKLSEEHRQRFPLDQGVISKAWEHQECVDIKDCPLYSEDPDGYQDYNQNTYGYDSGKLESLAMKSCSFVGVSVTDAGENIGVIIFESENKNIITEEKVKEIKKYCSEHQSHMSQFVRDIIALDRSTFKSSDNMSFSAEADLMKQITG